MLLFPPMKAAAFKYQARLVAATLGIIGILLWVQSDQFKMILGVGMRAVPIFIVIALFVVLAWAAIKKNETAIFIFAAAACGVLVSIYHDSNGLRDLAWHDWLFIGWCLMALKDAAQLIIANGIAAGIAKAKTAEEDAAKKAAAGK